MPAEAWVESAEHLFPGTGEAHQWVAWGGNYFIIKLKNFLRTELFLFIIYYLFLLSSYFFHIYNFFFYNSFNIFFFNTRLWGAGTSTAWGFRGGRWRRAWGGGCSAAPGARGGLMTTILQRGGRRRLTGLGRRLFCSSRFSRRLNDDSPGKEGGRRRLTGLGRRLFCSSRWLDDDSPAKTGRKKDCKGRSKEVVLFQGSLMRTILKEKSKDKDPSYHNLLFYFNKNLIFTYQL